MPIQNIPLTKADFDASDWQEVIAASSEKLYWKYASLFFANAREAEEAGDSKTQEVFTLLGAVASLMLDADAKGEPLAPQLVLKTGRSASVDDFTDAHLALFQELLPDIADAEMRARIGDLLWIRKRDYQSAQIAITAYLASAQTLENPENWPEGADRLERALHIAVRLDRKVPQSIYYPQVIAAIEGVLARYNGEDPSFLSATMMELLLAHHEGDARHYATLAEKAALRATAGQDWHRARTYWSLTARWHAREDDADGQRAALLCEAETYVAEAEQAVARPAQGYLAAVHHLQQAIEAFRRISGTQGRLAELHHLLLTYQRQSRAELKSFSSTVDVTDMAEQARAAVKGKPLLDALFALALLSRPPAVATLRRQVEATAKNYPLQHLLGRVMLDEEGRTVGRRPAMHTDARDQVEQAMRAEMFANARLYQTVLATGMVEPALRQITADHRPRVADLLPIVKNNPFVPPGRELIVARGLYSGLTSDFLVAAHLLIPQLEAAIRYVLEQGGVITTQLDANLIQDQFDLNTLMWKFAPQLNRLFGEDLTFDLQGLLVHRHGANLRNLLAHGLLDHDIFFSPQVVYLWWLTLRVCCVQILLSDDSEEPENGQLDHDDQPSPE